MAAGTFCKILTIICALQLAAGWDRFTTIIVKYGLDKSEAFYQLPINTSHPLIENYVKVEPEAGFTLPVDFYCYPLDPRLCIMYDRKGNPAGIQTSILKQDVANVSPDHYNYETISDYISTNFFNIPAYSKRTYFTNPEKLTEEGRQDTNEVAEGLWTYLDGELFQFPRLDPYGKFGEFYLQACFPAMGKHYFYKVTKSADCQKQFSMFALYDHGGLIGYGMANVGIGSHGPERGWYEKPPKQAVNIIAPDRPQCMDNLQDLYGSTTNHVYLVEEPWTITCPAD